MWCFLVVVVSSTGAVLTVSLVELPLKASVKTRFDEVTTTTLLVDDTTVVISAVVAGTAVSFVQSSSGPRGCP